MLRFNFSLLVRSLAYVIITELLREFRKDWSQYSNTCTSQIGQYQVSRGVNILCLLAAPIAKQNWTTEGCSKLRMLFGILPWHIPDSLPAKLSWKSHHPQNTTFITEASPVIYYEPWDKNAISGRRWNIILLLRKKLWYGIWNCHVCLKGNCKADRPTLKSKCCNTTTLSNNSITYGCWPTSQMKLYITTEHFT